MKRKLWRLMLSLTLLLTACTAPRETQEPQLTYEQQLSRAVALCREDLPKGMAVLAALDAQLLDGKQVKSDRCTLGVYQLRCGQRNVLLWRLDCAAAEENSGTLDTLHLTWEGADYYSSEGDGVYSTVRGREEKSVAFNVQDGDLSTGGSACGAVYLKSPATAYDARLEHTVSAQETILTTDANTLTATTREVQQVWTLHLDEHKEDAS